jgi:uncharacterized membrane protein
VTQTQSSASRDRPPERRALAPAQRAWLLDEMKVWQSLGLLSGDGADEILALYETQRDSTSRQHATAIFVLLAVAAIFVALAALLLVGYNWEAMPTPLKLAIVFGVLGGTHALGFYLRYTAGKRRGSEVVFFLGCLFYGAAIALVAQIFHLNSHYPDGFWWWALGVLPFALCLDTLLLHLLAVSLLGAWIGTEILGFSHLGFWFFGRWPSFPNGCYTLLPLAGLGLAWAYRKQSPVAVGLYVPLIAFWAILQPMTWHWTEFPVFFIGSVGGFLLLCAELHPSGSTMAIPYRFWGAMLALGTLIPLSYIGFYNEFFRGRHDEAFDLPLCLALVVLAALALALALRRGRVQDPAALTRPLHAMLVRQWLPFGVMLLMLAFAAWDRLLSRSGLALIPTVLANVAMLAAAYWLVTIGLREDRGQPFAGGVIYFLLWAILRYIDLFGDAGGMLGAALMFFLCGAAVFGVAMFWNRRRQMEASHG